MIGHIQGGVFALKPGYCIVAAGGVGYKIAATKDTLGALRLGGQTGLWTYLAVREDALDLYGFAHEQDLRFFELLLTVSGIGPKSALTILNVASAATLRSAIAAGNASYLTNVSGIGKKTAQKIVLELKDKIAAESGQSAAVASDEDTLAALIALGYSTAEARDALKHVPSELSGSPARLREALKFLGGS